MNALALGFVLALTTSVPSLEEAYVDAWLSGDREAVMRLFTEDAVLVPSRLEPVQGSDAMRRFWWPDDGSPAAVNSFETTIDGAEDWRGGSTHTFRITHDMLLETGAPASEDSPQNIPASFSRACFPG